MRSEDVSLFGKAAAPMVKQAVDFNSGAGAALIGALGGGGLGFLTHAMTPKDEDEDQRKRLLSHILAGALAGGAAGYGYNTLRRTANDTGVTDFASSAVSDGGSDDQKRPLWKRVANPMWSSLFFAGSGGTLGNVGYHGFNDWLTRHGIETSRSIDIGGKNVTGPGGIISNMLEQARLSTPDISKLTPDEQKQVYEARKIINSAYQRPSTWRQLISGKARDARRTADAELFEKIMNWSDPSVLRGQDPGTISSAVRRGIRGGRNPRRLIRALERQATRGSTATKLTAAAVLAALGIGATAIGK